MTQSVWAERDNNSPLLHFKFNDSDHTPSWLRYGKGYASIEVTTHKDRPYLDFHVLEGNLAPNGRSKRTYVNMSPENGRKLYEWLKSIYEPEVTLADVIRSQKEGA